MLNENVDDNKYNNNIEVKSLIVDKQHKMLENCNYCKKLTRSNKLINYFIAIRFHHVSTWKI